MSIFSSYKKIFLLGFIIVILIAIPFSVYIAQKRQTTTTQASKSTTLSFTPAETSVKTDEILSLDILLDPGTGSSANQVSYVKLSVVFDSAKFTATNDCLTPNPNSPNTLKTILEDATCNEAGKASISLSIGADPTDVVTTKTKIAVLKLKAITPVSNTVIKFDTTTQVLSIASSDQTSENVLSTTTDAKITITGSASPTSSPSSSSSSSTPTPTSAPADSSGSTTQSPTITTITNQTGFPVGSASGTIELPSPTIIVQQPIITIPPQGVISIPPTGPGENIVAIGIIGAIFTVIGTALLIML